MREENQSYTIAEHALGRNVLVYCFAPKMEFNSIATHVLWGAVVAAVFLRTNFFDVRPAKRKGIGTWTCHVYIDIVCRQTQRCLLVRPLQKKSSCANIRCHHRLMQTKLRLRFENGECRINDGSVVDDKHSLHIFSSYKLENLGHRREFGQEIYDAEVHYGAPMTEWSVSSFRPPTRRSTRRAVTSESSSKQRKKI